jgi:predicted RNA-binding Zn-ribbon protein involved in translation (DUF1610 family)
MAYTLPDSMDGLVYFTRRNIAETRGKTIAWVPKQRCPKCKKGLMAKPLDPKTGRPQVRAKEYACPQCKHTEERSAHEAKLSALILYECPFCGSKGETTAPFARRSWYGKKAIAFACAKCGERLGLTKKLSTPPDFIARVQGRPTKGKARKDTGAEAPDEDDDF